jgi:hypothetical protein
MAALAAAPVAQRASRSGARRGALAGIAAVCLLALLAGGVYWAYASLYPIPSQITLARYFPASTIVYAAIDLQNYAQNSQGKSALEALTGPAGKSMLENAGLDWTTDVQPWAGPIVALGAYASLPTGTSTTSGSLAALDAVAMTVVLQSRDDGAAKVAVQKAVAHQQAAGNTYQQSSYGGYTVYVSPSGRPSGEVIALGGGVVLLSSTEPALHAAIDRANGSGTTLGGDSSFQQAVGSLSANRFGTLYYNVRSLTDPTGLGVSAVSLPFVDTYPAGVGALTWTSAGMRCQLTMTPAHGGAPTANVSGDTTSLAALVPANAVNYVGVANLGAFSHELTSLLASGQPTGKAGPAQDFLPGVFGVPSSAPGTQVPAATFVEITGAGTNGDSTNSVALLREPSAASASSLMATIATQQHWTRNDTTIAGLPAASYFATDDSPTSALPGNAADDASSTKPIAVEAYVQGVMVLASNAEGLLHVAAVARRQSPSLGQAAKFRQMTAIAPSGAAATLFGSTGALNSLVLGAPRVAVTTSDSTSVSLGTLTWTAASLQITYDVSAS